MDKIMEMVDGKNEEKKKNNSQSNGWGNPAHGLTLTLGVFYSSQDQGQEMNAV